MQPERHPDSGAIAGIVRRVSERHSRRRFLGGLGAAAFATAFLAACGSDDDDATASATATESGSASGGTPAPMASEAAAEGFTFTDGRGVTVTLDRKPERVVAYAAPAAALWHLGITPVGIFSGALLEESANLNDIDLDGIEAVGTVYGEIDVEKLAALQPDLVVTAFSPLQGEVNWGFADIEVQSRVAAVAPIVAINGIEDPTDVIASFEALAEAMGVATDAEEQAAARARFDAAVADLKAATAEKPGLTTLAVTSYDSQLYFAEPSLFPALRQMASWGLNVTEPTGNGEAEFYETVSYEEANKYPVDLILFDSQLDLADLADVGTWQAVPAVQAGQIVPWDKLENWSYAAYAADIEAIVAGIRAADADLVTEAA